jgi:pullulanase/glycogen debranching enzyme
MTRKLFIFSTIAFWIAVAGLGTTSVWWLPAGQGAAQAKEQTISPADLAKHRSPENCWMAIRGAVYDLSTYLPEHPSRWYKDAIIYELHIKAFFDSRTTTASVTSRA